MTLTSLKKYYLAIRKRAYLSLRKRYIIVRRHGAIFLLDMLNHIDRQVEAFGFYEQAQTRYFLNSAFEMGIDIFLDVGAHWGLYSVLFTVNERFRGIEVLAFEPDPVNRLQLCSNIFLNQLHDRISVFSEALSDHDGVVSFQRHPDENRGRSRINENGEVIVRSIRLDSFRNYSGRKIAIKIDVEGHEGHVLRGMENLLLNNICILQVEAFGDSASQVKDQMEKYGYKQIKKIDCDFYYLPRSFRENNIC